MKLRSVVFVLAVAGVCRLAVAEDLERVFQNPPDAAKPRVMWMWMGTNLTKEGITRDLEALKDAGFGGAVMFSLADTTSPWPCPIANSPTPGIIAFTDPWWEMVRHAAGESKRLGLDFGMASSPGYSTSGGPWIPPELSMSELCFSETLAKGPGKIALNLPKPTVDPRGKNHFPVFDPQSGKVDKPEIPARKTFYRDIAVLAMPAVGVAPKAKVFDLTGKTEWDAPVGDWKIYRFGYTTKGILLQPPQWEAQGLELDKLNPEAISFHMKHVLGEIKTHLGDLVGHGLNFVHFDSYEAGVPEWTPAMREEFRKRRGYDLTPFLAVRAKRVIGSKAETDKFNRDFTDTVHDLFRDVYYPTIAKMLHEAGLEFSNEPYWGPWRPAEVVPMPDRVMVEFWTTAQGLIRFGCRDIIAAQRKTGRELIESEAFTATPALSLWKETPAWIKPMGDAIFCEGVNRLVLHRFTPQPWGDRWKPGNAMGQWGTHFDRTQTWWEPGKAMFRYWQRCQALLQWGRIAAPDFEAGNNSSIKAIHRRNEGADIWFVANIAQQPAAVVCEFAVAGRQPELWDAVWGTMRDLPEYRQQGGKTVIPMQFAPAQSFFVVFRKETKPSAGGRNFPAYKPSAMLEGPWEVRFDPQWGGPETVTFEKLDDWTKRPEPGIRYYSGTATYRKMFDGRAGTALDLGTVNHLARVRINGRDLGVVWCAPWRAEIPAGVLREKGNLLEIEVTNVWANRLIGDEQEPPDCEFLPGHMGHGGYLKRFPDWFVKNQPRPSKGRYCFTTWNYFKKDSPLVPSGLLGPVTIQAAEGTSSP